MRIKEPFRNILVTFMAILAIYGCAWGARAIPNPIGYGETPASSTKMNANFSYLCTELDNLETAAVLDALFNANTVIYATSDNTPAALTVAEDTVVGRVSGGNIAALTSADLHTLLTYVVNPLDETFDISNEKLNDVKVVSFNGVVDNGNSGTEKTIDLSAGQKHKLTLTGDATVTLSSADVGNYLLMVYQDSTGGRTCTLSSVKWPGGSAPTFSAVSEDIDIVNLFYDGSSYYGQIAQDFE